MHIFGGDLDNQSPPFVIKKCGKAIRGSTTTLLKGGHLAIFSHFKEIASTFVPVLELKQETTDNVKKDSQKPEKVQGNQDETKPKEEKEQVSSGSESAKIEL